MTQECENKREEGRLSRGILLLSISIKTVSYRLTPYLTRDVKGKALRQSDPALSGEYKKVQATTGHLTHF